MDRKFLFFWITVFVLIVADIIVKVGIHSNFYLGETIQVIPDFFNITYVRNKGAAFGFLAESHETFRKIFFALLPPLVCAFIFYHIKKQKNLPRLELISFSLIVGGALGNYVNRMYHGYVIDFLDFHIAYKYVWPAFNIADIAIFCGVGLLLLYAKKHEKSHKVAQDINQT